ncbi:MAG: metallophosphoesterase [Deltaproteobacteria bacterium]|nr:metallophosphoesterase [Deltaproteobacteria bacterium]
MLIFLFFFISIIALVHFYLWQKLVNGIISNKKLKIVATVILACLAVLIPASMMISRQSDSTVFIRYFSFIPMTWLGFMMLLFFFFAATDLISLILKIITKLKSKKVKVSKDAIENPDRRDAFKKIAAVTAYSTIFPIGGFAVYNGMRKPTVIKKSLAINNFPEALNGFKIVQLTDLHLGLTIAGKWLNKVVEQVNMLNPDLVVITGDLIDGEVSLLAGEVESLTKLKSKHGVFFVTGNHEYYFGVEKWVNHLKTIGINVLLNENVKIGDNKDFFYLAGVNDHDAKRVSDKFVPDFDKALSGLSNDESVILLAHQPAAVFEAEKFNVDLMLSGHTHGGQIWPFNYLLPIRQPYLKGLYRHNKKLQIYVNQGTGYWGPPMRLGTECEITEITLNNGN